MKKAKSTPRKMFWLCQGDVYDGVFW